MYYLDTYGQTLSNVEDVLVYKTFFKLNNLFDRKNLFFILPYKCLMPFVTVKDIRRFPIYLYDV